MTNQLEALLFFRAEPMSIGEIARALMIEEELVPEIASQLKSELVNRGITLVEHRGSYLLTTSPETSALIARQTTEEKARELSKGALEVLAIIAYEAPVSQSHIEMIRGVNSQSALRQLLMRGLVERKRESDAAAFLYSPTIDLISHLGLTSLAELPSYDDHKRAISEFVHDSI